MKKSILHWLLGFTCFFGYGQDCPDLTAPFNGAVGVAVDATINWQAVPGVTGYILSLGTTPGGNDILNNQNVGSATSYSPPLGLPQNTQVFATITLFLLNQPNISCPAQSFTTATITDPPLCSAPQNPLDGATAVNPATNISWSYAVGATGYRVTIGTSPGGSEIANGIAVTNSLNYKPTADLPQQTTIYVSIVPFNAIGPALSCASFSFTTGQLAPLPSCTQLISPANGAVNVPLSPVIEWMAVPEATGYQLTIGSSPGDDDILEQASIFTNSTPVIDFEPNKTFFITIVPFNSAGTAIGCITESFSTMLGCGPYIEPSTGELVSLNPDVRLESNYTLCKAKGSLSIVAPTGADGYRWYQEGALGAAMLIHTGDQVSITAAGAYYLEAYNNTTAEGSNLECTSIASFTVSASEKATITNTNITEGSMGINIAVEVSGNGVYEYALNNSNGPYQDSAVFTNIPAGSNTVYVRDKNGCGIVSKNITQDINLIGFPKFFTPNGDNLNDYWQFKQPQQADRLSFKYIAIYDRFGKFISQFNQETKGWDGTLNGQAMPAGDYWFKAMQNNGHLVKGHFTLKR